jgi:hypothetical protein
LDETRCNRATSGHLAIAMVEPKIWGFLRFWGGWRKDVEVWSISRLVLVSADTKTFGPRFINQGGEDRGE